MSIFSETDLLRRLDAFREIHVNMSLNIALFCVANFILVPLVICFMIHLFLKPRSESLPPLAEVPFRKIAKDYIEGTFHRSFVETASEIGLVFEIQTPFQMVHHFMICDSSLARVVLEGDRSRHIPPGIKRSTIKCFDKLTMNTPNILTKQTHGEG
jgi:hypothetical protein